MKKFDREVVALEKFVPGGQALGALPDGRKVFVWGGLPGETAEVEITKSKSSYAEGIVAKVLIPSPRRIEPKDPCYLSTSPWQILDYPYELQQKAEILQEIFRQQEIDVDKIEPATDGKDFHYRNKMEYALYWDNEKEQIDLAFHARGTHRKVPINQSSIERPEIITEAQKIVKQLNDRCEPARKYQSLLVRANQTGQVSAALFENHKPHPKMPELADTLLGREYSYSPNGFFQINLPVYEMALIEIKKHINTEKVLDLYAGVGTIGLSVAPDKQLTLVEVNKAAFSELTKNCRGFSDSSILRRPEARPRISATTLQRQASATRSQNEETENPAINPILAKSEEVLDFITSDSTIILDPPRAGTNNSLIEKLLEVKPPTIIYLSCNPVTQARDLKPLLEKYQITQLQPFNFFPRTPHIENLAILSLK
jgi:23S rRNA (uracil1939-C5)-methyltransferase